MVDLVKIRRKARQKAAQAAAAQAGSPAAEPAVEGSGGAEVLGSAGSEGRVEILSPAERLERYKEQIGQVRPFMAESAEQQEPAGGAETELLAFVLGGEQYAIDIGSIVEIIPVRPATRVPNAGRSIVGIISLRGTVVTLIDVRSRLGHPPAAPTADSRIVVIGEGGEMAGFVVDRILRVVRVDPEKIESPPAVHPDERSECVRGVFRQRNSLTILLEVERLLSAEFGGS
jgi:purine-binding chemotaxis protein CheW